MRLFFVHPTWICFAMMALLGSCVSAGKISVQVPIPPIRSIPSDIQSVVLMNRSMTSIFSNHNQDSMKELFRGHRERNITLHDSLASDTLIRSLANAMYESGRFDVVVPVRRNLPNFNLLYMDNSPPLTQKQVEQICHEFDVDALLSLEKFQEKLKSSNIVGYSDEETGIKLIDAYLQISSHSNWALYQPKEKLLITKFEVNDTIFWEMHGHSLNQTYKKLPPLKKALLDGAIEHARTFASDICPAWKPEERIYFVAHNREVDKAVASLKKNEWQEAGNIWKNYAHISSPALRSKIEFNLALASEMNGNITEAIEWAQKSIQTKYSKAAVNYLRLLKDANGK